MASQARTRQKGCGFIHSRPLGRRPAPQPPQVRIPSQGALPERLLDLGLREPAPGQTGNFSLGTGSPCTVTPVAILTPPRRSGPYLFAKVQKGKKEKLRNGPAPPPLGWDWAWSVRRRLTDKLTGDTCNNAKSTDGNASYWLLSSYCVPSPVLGTYNAAFKLPSNLCEVAAVVIPILSTRKLRHREVKSHL